MPGSRSQSYDETVDQPSTSAQPMKPSTSRPAARPPHRRQGLRAAMGGAAPAPSAGRAMAPRDRQQAVVARSAADEGRVDLERRAHGPGDEPRRRAPCRASPARLQATAEGAAVDLPVVEAGEREAPALDPDLGEARRAHPLLERRGVVATP